MRLGHRRVAGRVVRFLDACGGVEVGYCGPGLVDAGNGHPLCRQVPEVEGYRLRCRRQRLVVTVLGPLLEAAPGGGVRSAGVVGLGVLQPGGDGLGCVPVALSQLKAVVWPDAGGQIAGHGEQAWLSVCRGSRLVVPDMLFG